MSHKDINKKPTLVRLKKVTAGVLDPDLAAIALDALDIRQLELLLSIQKERDSASVGPAGKDAND